jgi:hypothetical protein
LENPELVTNPEKAAVNLVGDVHEVALLCPLCGQFPLLKIDVGAVTSVAPIVPLCLLGVFAVRKEAFEPLSGLLGAIAGLGDERVGRTVEELEFLAFEVDTCTP